MLARAPPLVIRGLNDEAEQRGDRILDDQALTIFNMYGERRHTVVRKQAKQPVVLGLFPELTFAAHAIEDLQEHGGRKFLMFDAGAIAFLISVAHAGEEDIHSDQHLLSYEANQTQQMVGGTQSCPTYAG